MMIIGLSMLYVVSECLSNNLNSDKIAINLLKYTTVNNHILHWLCTGIHLIKFWIRDYHVGLKKALSYTILYNIEIGSKNFSSPPHFVGNVVFSKCNKGIWKQYIRQLCTYYIASGLSPFIKRKYKSPKAIFQIIAGFQVYIRNAWASDTPICCYRIKYVSIFEL